MSTTRYPFLVCCVTVVLLAAMARGVLDRRAIPLGAYATSLGGRTASQVANAGRAAEAMDGTVLRPGGEFSFVATTGPWTVDRGYRKAPVSYDGELVRSFGGGVCQTSSTLYCAALAAGLDVLERHRHTWPAGYVPPGGDAAVAPGGIDLRLRNPYPFAVRLRAGRERDELICRVEGRAQPGAQRRPLPTFLVRHETTDIVPAPEVSRPDSALPRGSRKVLKRGQPGYHVRTTRLRVEPDGSSVHRLISEDCYPPLSRVVRVGTGPG